MLRKLGWILCAFIILEVIFPAVYVTALMVNVFCLKTHIHVIWFILVSILFVLAATGCLAKAGTLPEEGSNSYPFWVRILGNLLIYIVTIVVVLMQVELFIDTHYQRPEFYDWAHGYMQHR